MIVTKQARHGLTLTFVILILDQITKHYAVQHFAATYHTVEVTPFFNLVLVWNTGISFGMLQNLENGHIYLSMFALVVVMILLIWIMRVTILMEALAIGAVIGGALGNVIDRLRYGAVVDFFDFHVAGYHWPAFNVADSAVFIGAVLLCYVSFFMHKKDDDTENDKTNE